MQKQCTVCKSWVFSSVEAVPAAIHCPKQHLEFSNNTDPDGTVTETNFKVDGNTGNVSITGKLLLPDGSASAQLCRIWCRR